MTTRQLLTIVQERGLRVVVKNGLPVIVTNGKREQVTDKLLAVLKRHRERIIELLSPTVGQTGAGG